MVEVVTKEEFVVIVDQLRLCQQELEFMRSLLMNQRWLNRRQTMHALNICESTLWRLTKMGELTYRKQGRLVFYDVFSLRAYLTSQRVEAWHVNRRLLAAAFYNEPEP